MSRFPTTIDPRIWSACFLNAAKALVDDLEGLETPSWALRAFLKRELLTRRIFDPNCGTGNISRACIHAGYEVIANDIFDWGYKWQDFKKDFLSKDAAHHFSGIVKNQTVFMNPPFRKSAAFFEVARAMQPRKIVMFNTFSFYGSQDRKPFLDSCEPSRIYVCADRATCWRFDVPEWKRKGTTPKQFAFFVWDFMPGQCAARPAPSIHRLYKKEGAV